MFPNFLDVYKRQDKYHIPLIINDRIDIEMAVQATGVHIGQHDLPAAAVRKVIGENMLLGVSASSIAEAIQAPVSYTHLDVYKRQILSQIMGEVPGGCAGHIKITPAGIPVRSIGSGL